MVTVLKALKYTLGLPFLTVFILPAFSSSLTAGSTTQAKGYFLLLL